MVYVYKTYKKYSQVDPLGNTTTIKLYNDRDETGKTFM